MPCLKQIKLNEVVSSCPSVISNFTCYLCCLSVYFLGYPGVEFGVADLLFPHAAAMSADVVILRDSRDKLSERYASFEPTK